MRFNKLLLILPVMMMGFATTNAMAAKTCGPEVLGYSGNQDPDDNEFLYASKSQFDAAKAGYENTNHTTSGSGKGYECDNEHCSNTSIVDMPAGHVFKGEVINHKETYQCQANKWDDFDDYWYPVGKGVCHAGKTYGDINVGQKHSGRLSKEECSGFELTDDLGVEFDLICREGPKLVCKAMKCRDGFKADNGKCVADNKVDPKPNPDPKPKPDPNPNPSGCRASRMGNAIGMACCDLKSSEAKWDGSSCNCVDTTKEFKINAKGKGECVAKTETVVPAACNCSVDLTLVANAESSCAAKSMASAINMVKVECGKGAGCNGQTVSVYVNAIAEAMNSCSAPVEDESNVNTKRLAEAVAALDKYRSGLDVSVWKDAEGNFNTARLVSDSIAGVVLGTAGGLITSSVVKKNQVKSGFEDVVCTIGGQEVGSYGDEISVGIQ